MATHVKSLEQRRTSYGTLSLIVLMLDSSSIRQSRSRSSWTKHGKSLGSRVRSGDKSSCGDTYGPTDIPLRTHSSKAQQSRSLRWIMHFYLQSSHTTPSSSQPLLPLPSSHLLDFTLEILARHQIRDIIIILIIIGP